MGDRVGERAGAVYVHDHAKRIVFIIPAGATLFSASSPFDIIGSPVMRFIHPECSETTKPSTTSLWNTCPSSRPTDPQPKL